jgi:predicted nuclease of predicted toxin-antitoxin system
MSKRPSASRSSSQPDPVYFVDRSLGRHVVADALKAAGARVEVHDDHFPRDAADVEWLARAGREGWIVLTRDKKIRRNGIELAAVLEHSVAVFVVLKSKATGAETAQLLVRNLPRMARHLRGNRVPFIAGVAADSLHHYKLPPRSR